MLPVCLSEEDKILLDRWRQMQQPPSTRQDHMTSCTVTQPQPASQTTSPKYLSEPVEDKCDKKLIEQCQLLEPLNSIVEPQFDTNSVAEQAIECNASQAGIPALVNDCTAVNSPCLDASSADLRLIDTCLSEMVWTPVAAQMSAESTNQHGTMLDYSPLDQFQDVLSLSNCDTSAQSVLNDTALLTSQTTENDQLKADAASSDSMMQHLTLTLGLTHSVLCDYQYASGCGSAGSGVGRHVAGSGCGSAGSGYGVGLQFDDTDLNIISL